MQTNNLVALLAAARSGQIQEVDKAVLEQYGLDESVLHLTVDDLADHLLALQAQMQEERQQAELLIHQQALLKIEQLKRDLVDQRAKLLHEKEWADNQIQTLTYKCEQYEAILPGVAAGNIRWMSFRTWWFVIGVVFLMLLTIKAEFAVDSLIFTLGWLLSYSGVFLGKALGFFLQPLRDLIRLPALRRYAPRLGRDAHQPVRTS